MPRLIFARNLRPIEKPRFRDRLRCWRRGGHFLYRNLEFGDLWCGGPCMGIWHLPTDPFS